MARFGVRQGERHTPSPTERHDDDHLKKVVVTARCTPAIREKANRTAQALGISVSALLCELIERLELDEHDHPGWTSRYAAADEPGPDETQQQTLELSA